MGTWHPIVTAERIREGGIHGTRIGGEFVGVARVDGELYAFDDMCTHEECLLSDGMIDNGNVVCGCHGAEFDARTGEVRLGPATEPIRMFPCRVVDGKVEVELG